MLSNLDLAVILSVFTGLCYILTYLYYIGFFMHYKLPVEFIDIDVKAVILTMLILSPSILILIINLLLNFKNKAQSNNMINRNEKREIKDLDKEINNLDYNNKSYYKSIVDLKIKLSSLKNDIEEKLTGKLPNVERESLEEEKSKINKLEKEIKELEQAAEKIEQNLAYENTNLNDVKERLFKLRIQMVKRLSILSILSCILVLLMVYFLKANLYIVIYFIIGQLGLLWLTEMLYREKKFFLIAISIIIYLVIFAYSSGVNYAYLQEKHIIFEVEENHYIALTVYKDKFLYAQYNLETNQVEDRFSLINIKDVKSFSKRKTGKIKVINKPLFEQ